MLKNAIFHQSEDDAIEISRAVYGSDIDGLLGLGLYFQKRIGDTDQCLTGADIVELVFFDQWHEHLEECPKCRAMYDEMKGKDFDSHWKDKPAPPSYAPKGPSPYEKAKVLSIADTSRKR
jgi:hypothetical protein